MPTTSCGVPGQGPLRNGEHVPHPGADQDSAPATGALPTPDVVDETTLGLALRLACILGTTRVEGQFNLEMFLNAAERGMGGTLVVENPSKRKRRERAEVRFASEGFQVETGITAIGFD